MSILFACRRCAKDTDSKDAHEGLCGDCFASFLINPYRAEISRLVSKRDRYGRRGISVINLDQQLGSLCNRAEKKARDSAPTLTLGQIRNAIAEVLTGGRIIRA